MRGIWRDTPPCRQTFQYPGSTPWFPLRLWRPRYERHIPLIGFRRLGTVISGKKRGGFWSALSLSTNRCDVFQGVAQQSTHPIGSHSHPCAIRYKAGYRPVFLRCINHSRYCQSLLCLVQTNTFAFLSISIRLFFSFFSLPLSFPEAAGEVVWRIRSFFFVLGLAFVCFAFSHRNFCRVSIFFFWRIYLGRRPVVFLVSFPHRRSLCCLIFTVWGDGRGEGRSYGHTLSHLHWRWTMQRSLLISKDCRERETGTRKIYEWLRRLLLLRLSCISFCVRVWFRGLG